MPENCTTWEDYYVLKNRYPDAAIWEADAEDGAHPREGETVTPSTMSVDIQSPGPAGELTGPSL
jgi:hypothetical protein